MTDHPFDRLLRQAATTYRQFYPGEEMRLGRGLEIALNTPPYFYTDIEGKHAARVRSSVDAEVEYVVRGTHCDCPDQAAPGQRCKHRWAVALTRIAQALYDLRDDEAV